MVSTFEYACKLVNSILFNIKQYNAFLSGEDMFNPGKCATCALKCGSVIAECIAESKKWDGKCLIKKGKSGCKDCIECVTG